MNAKKFLNEKHITELLLPRFLSYTKIFTTSDLQKADEGIQPSTETQIAFAQKLKDELIAIGVKDVLVTEFGYVCGRLYATNNSSSNSICLLAHMDTASDVSGKNVNPQIFENYDGSLIELKEGVYLDSTDDEFLKDCIGDTIITTDGSTLLGADDKAGIAEILTAIELLIKSGESHGQIEIIFSPDEETGHGMDNVPTDWITSKQCYTLDGGNLGEIETECFNAFKATVDFTGIAVHTGTARGKLVNAVSMASKFVSMLPQNESPETTDGYQGFYAPLAITGHIENASVDILLRDFSKDGMQRRIDSVLHIAKAIESIFVGGKIQVTFTQQYLNMKEELDKSPLVSQKLINAVKNVGIEPIFKPIRGGTDGSRLTEMGYPTPNIFTGGHNFHSRKEWASLSQMVCSVKVIQELIKQWAE